MKTILFLALILVASAYADDKKEEFDPDNEILVTRRRIARCVDQKVREERVDRSDKQRIMNLKATCVQPGDVEDRIEDKKEKSDK